MATAALPAWAGNAEFQNCDGYPMPGKKSDGMTGYSGWFGSAAADIRKSTKNEFGMQGINFCDIALNDPLLQAIHWRRKAHLLQAKSLHQIVSGELDGAFASLAASDALGVANPDPDFDDSIAIGNMAVRAYAYIVAGNKAEAEKEIARVAAARPHSPDIVRLAQRLTARLDGNIDRMMTMLRKQMPENPINGYAAFWLTFWRGDFKQALQDADQVSFQHAEQLGAYTDFMSHREHYQPIYDHATVSGAAAYALMATGNPAAARAKIEAARKQLEVDMAPPPPTTDGKPQKKSVVREHATRVSFGTGAGKKLDAWSWAMGWRESLPGKDLDLAFTEYKESLAKDLNLEFDILRTAKPKPDQLADAARRRDDETGKIDKELKEIFSVDLNGLYNSLPRPETAKGRPTFGKGGFLSGGGYDRRGYAKLPDAMTLRYYHAVGTRPMVEELVLLAAATEAQKAGKDSVLLYSRQATRVTVSYGYYGSYGTPTAAGHDGQLLARFINKADVPKDAESWRWRLLDAATIVRDLGPKFAPKVRK